MKVKEAVKSITKKREPEPEPAQQFISTGSTLLDLAISGGVCEEGGIPGGILVELFGPSGSGKTAVLCEIAGDIQNQGGEVLFRDPEGRLDASFASIFGLNIALDSDRYSQPDTVTEFFDGIEDWKPTPSDLVHGICGDSLAALSTEMEMEKGDKMGARRAKEFSEELRKICRLIKQRNYLLVCSNQVRIDFNTGGTTTPGGKAVGFYSSLRLWFRKTEKLQRSVKLKSGVEQKRVIGICTQVEVYKSSIDKPHRTSPIYIIFDYGIDDIRGNLQYIKDMTKEKTYGFNGIPLGIGIEGAIKKVEKEGLGEALKERTIELWNEIESQFDSARAPKHN
jgi:RecA/RadA recombinase